MRAIIPTLTLSPAWSATESYSDTTNVAQLGDGYTVNGAASIHPNSVEWNISRAGLRKIEVDEIIDFLSSLGGVNTFLWSPHPDIAKRLFFCEKWTVNLTGIDTYEFSATFIEDVRGSCAAYAALVDTDEILAQLLQASDFITSFSSTTGNYLINSSNNLVVRSLHTHSEQIPSDSGTLYDQLTLALACLNAYDLTESAIWLTRATNYANAIISSYYNSSSGAPIYLPHWLFDIKSNNRREDIYYTARTLNTGEVNAPLGWMPMLWELYDRLFSITSNSSCQTLANITKTDTITASTFSNQSYVYRKNSGSVTEYPGTQITGSASRISSGTLQNYVNVSGSGILIVENVDSQTSLTSSTTYTVEASANTSNRVVEFFISNITDDASEASIYRQFWRLGIGTTINSRTFASHELFRWEAMTWYYGIGLISGIGNYEENSITYNGQTFNNVVLRLDNAAQLNINVNSNNPFKIFCRVVTSPATLRLKDSNGYYWDYTLAIAGWNTVSPTWEQFIWSPINPVTQSGRTPSQSGNIQELHILTTGNIYIWWIGINPPQSLVLPTVAYRAGVRDRASGSRNLYVGDVYPNNTPTNQLNYTPGTVPFARNITTGVVGNLTGLPYAAYQNTWGLVKWEQHTRLSNVLSFLRASQLAYTTAIIDTGPFAPVYTWNDINNSSTGGTLNTFGFNGFDNFELSGQYQAQVGLWLARAWYEDPSNSELRSLAMSWINWLDQVFATREADLPPNEFPSNQTAIAGGNPGVQALIGEAALWCNLAGGDTGITFRWIYRSLTYLNYQFVDTGSMSGSWAQDQPTFASTLKSYYSWWHGACINFLSLLAIYKESITYPPCSESLTIVTSEPIPEICCNSPIVPPVPTDPYFSSVHLLLHFEGSNGSTTFIDSSSFARSVTLSSPGPTISTINPLVGTSSGLFTGAGGNLVVADFGLTNVSFTIEAFISLADVIGNKVIYSIYGNSWETQIRAFFLFVSGDKLSVYYAPSAGVSTFPLISSTSLIPNRVYYVAFTYNHDSGVWSIYIDGELEDSKVVTTKIDSFTFNHQIGGAFLSTNITSFRFNGRIDELRVTRGIVRPITSIPTVPFPNS